MKKYGYYFLVFLIGITIGIGVLVGIAYLPLKPRHRVYTALGIQKYHVIGFLPYWLLSKAVSPYEQYLTEYSYFGLAIDSDGTIQKLTTPQEEEPGWTALKGDTLRGFFEKAKKENMDISLLVHTANEQTIADILQQPQKHAQNLLTDVVPIMQKYGFNDLNLDIESFVEATEGAQVAYTEFVRTISEGIKTKNLGTLTIELPVMAFIKPRATNPRELVKLADRFVVMAYDYHYAGSYLTGPVAPLAGSPQKREIDITNIISEALSIIPRKKLLLGIPLYGYEWETISDTPGAATIPGGASTASVKRMRELLATCSNCQKLFDDIGQVPLVVEPHGAYFHQIYYENTESLQKKLAFAEQVGLGGVAFWALGYEDDAILLPLRAYKKSFSFIQ